MSTSGTAYDVKWTDKRGREHERWFDRAIAAVEWAVPTLEQHGIKPEYVTRKKED